MKKILFYTSYPFVMAGSQRQLYELTVSLPKASYDVTVLTTREDGVSAFLRNEGVKVKVIPLPKPLDVFGKKLLEYSLLHQLSLVFPYLQYTIHILRFLRKERFDLIQCADRRAVLSVGLAKIITRTPIINYVQTRNAIGRLLNRVCEIISDKIVANGEFAVQDLSRKALDKTTIIYTVAASRYDDYCPTWIAEQKAAGKLIVGVFSNVIPFKGYHYFIDAISKMDQATQDKFIVICLGRFPEEYEAYHQWLQEKLQENQIENITFLGWQNKPYPFMNLCDMIVLPSIESEVLEIGNTELKISGNEGFPTVILEAMKMGKPVIGTNVASVKLQIVDNENGFLIPPKNATALKEAIEKLLVDEPLRQKMGEAGQVRYNTLFSTEAYIESFIKVYEYLLQK